MQKKIEIVDYVEALHREAFVRLNTDWITAHWQLEPHDIEVFRSPKAAIEEPGGHIFVGLIDGEPMGVCALCRIQMPPYDYELAKLAVSPEARGLGMGTRLCEAVVSKARQLGGKRLFIESNTLLLPALHIYEKLGCRRLSEDRPHYSRGDIFFSLDL